MCGSKGCKIHLKKGVWSFFSFLSMPLEIYVLENLFQNVFKVIDQRNLSVEKYSVSMSFKGQF